MRDRPELEFIRRLRRGGAVLTIILSIPVASCQDGIEPPVATTLEAIGDLVQDGVAGAAVAAVPTVRILDQRGDPMAGVHVSFTIVEGGGTIANASSPTDASGIASAVEWTLGTQVGHNAVLAASPSLEPLLFSAVGQPGAPASLTIVEGDAQSAVAGSTLPVPPTVRVADANANAVPGVTVEFRFAARIDTTSVAVMTTDQDGHASTSWTVGTRAGSDTLRAHVEGVGEIVFRAVVTPASPASMSVLEGDHQSAPVASIVPIPPAVQVFDAWGNATPGVEVRFEIASGGGLLGGSGNTSNAVVVADASGLAQIEGWQLGTRAGPNALRVVTGSAETLIDATGQAGDAAGIDIDEGDDQTAPAGSPVAIAPAVHVFDEFANPVAGQVVSFAVASGSGTVVGSTVETDATGTAAVDSWTLGDVGENTLVASLPGVGEVVFTASATTGSGSGSSGGGGSGSSGNGTYEIEIEFTGTPTTAEQMAFFMAAGRWSNVVADDLPDVMVSIPANACGITHNAVSRSIDDLLVLVHIAPIDGPGNILGSAGPCYVRSSGGLPVVGAVRIDSDDMAYLASNGRLEDVIAHEMGHVIGIGTRWRVLLVGAGGSDPTFVGTAAIAEFLSAGGTSYPGSPVPVENLGGPGTRDGHWRESVFRGELMTGWLDLSANPLSGITVAALEDIGYGVDYNGSEGFSVSVSAAAADELGTTRPPLELREQALPIVPIAVDERGRRVASRSIIR